MNKTEQVKLVTLGPDISLEEMVAIARFGATVEFSQEYCQRVKRARALIEKWTQEGRTMYGVTTGFGILCDQAISYEELALLQRNVIEASATSVGEPYTIEQARAVMVLVLQNLGSGYSGVRLSVLEQYRTFLNIGITPWAPREGSVGYLCTEAHLARTLYGEGKVYFHDRLMDTQEAFKLTGLQPIELEAKEGLSLISGTTAVTALGCLALYDMLNASKAADIIGAVTLEISKGLMPAFDEKVGRVRRHPHQEKTAENVRKILKGSQIIEEAKDSHIQDPLSLRAMPQLHGAVKKTLSDARETLELELNSCCDNPFVWTEEPDPTIISCCNCDSSYVGIEMDSACIAATTLAKMSERRNSHLLDGTMSGYPWFLVKNPGLNCGMMVPQYSQAAILNDMKLLSAPSSVDNIPTCGNQEDYVAMGYNASKKALKVVENLEYVLAYELLSAYAAQQFVDTQIKRSPAVENLMTEIKKNIPLLDKDRFFYPYVCYLKELIHSGQLVELVEAVTGELK